MTQATDKAPLPAKLTTDEMLRALVVLAEQGWSTTVTLFTGSAVISGTLVSSKKYLEYFDGALATFEKQAAAAFQAAGRDDSPTFELTDQACSLCQPREVEFVHLKDVVARIGSATEVTLKEALWRGTLRGVDGFFIGAPTGPA